LYVVKRREGRQWRMEATAARMVEGAEVLRRRKKRRVSG
jgi:hypothetical protein